MVTFKVDEVIRDLDFLADVLPTFPWKTYEIFDNGHCAIVIDDETDLDVAFARQLSGGNLGPTAWAQLVFRNRPVPAWAKDPGLSANVQNHFFQRPVTYMKLSRVFRIALFAHDVDPTIGVAIRVLDRWTKIGVPTSTERGSALAEEVQHDRLVARHTPLGEVVVHLDPRP
jgi:hypothetical protein